MKGLRPALVAGVLALLLALSLVPFLVPRDANPNRADAVVVLSGDHGERLARALELMSDKVAPTLVLDGTPDLQQVVELCRGEQAFEVVCLRPDPDSTRYEARAAARLATDRGWRTLVVVTTRYHVPRAGMLFRRCFEGSVKMVGATPSYGGRMTVRAVVHEWIGVAAALTIRRAC